MSTPWRSGIDRFMEKVEKTETCWLWMGATDAKGYGRFAKGCRTGITTAHRWSYEHFIGPAPRGLDIDHLCFNRDCANPAHLEAVTHRENLRRTRVRRSAAGFTDRTECSRGHELAAETTYTRPGGQGYLLCRTCDQKCGRRPYVTSGVAA